MADPVSLGLATVAQIGVSYLFPSKGPRLTDLKISASTYGSYIPYTFGVCRVAGNVIWADKIREKKHTVGKGGAQQTFTYSCSLAVAFCQGPIVTLRKLWADGKLIYDATGSSEVDHLPDYKFTVYNGTEDQLPNSLMESFLGAGNVPAYRGMCYVVFDTLPLQDFSNRLPQFTAEVFKDDNDVATGISTTMRIRDGSGYVYDGSQHLFDSTRGFGYLVSNNGIRRFRAGDGYQDKYVPYVGTNQGGVRNILAVSQKTGVLIVNSSLSNYAALYALDPNSLLVAGKQGSDSTFQHDGPSNWPYAAGGSIDGNEVFYFVTLFGEIYMTPLLYEAPYLLDGPEYVSLVASSGSLYRNYHIATPSTMGGIVYGRGGYADGTLETIIQIEGLVSALIYPPDGPPAQLQFGLDNLVWDDSTDGCLVFYHTNNHHYVSKIDRLTNQMMWTTMLPDGVQFAGGGQAGLILNGRIALIGSVVTAGRLYVLDTVTGRWLASDEEVNRPITIWNDSEIPNTLQSDPPYTNLGTVWGTGGFQFYDSYRDMIMITGSPSNRFVKVGQGVQEVSLGGILADMLRYGGLTEQNFDMSELDDILIAGYGWARSTDVKGIVDELCRVFSCDIIESEGKLIGRKRGTGQVVYTIPQNILGSSSPDASDFWTEVRSQEADLPSQISLSFMNSGDDYQTTMARSQRISAPYATVNSRQQVTMDVSIVMSASEAKTRARQMLYAQWAERSAHTTRLPWAYLDLDPADLITVEMNDGRSYNDRVQGTDIGADYTIELRSNGQDSGAYSLSAVADGGTGSYETPTISAPASAMPIVINSPLLRDQDDTNGSYSLYYAGIAGTSSSDFVGGDVARSVNGIDFKLLFGSETEVMWGSVADILGPPARGDFALDWTNTITVWPGSTSFELQSISEDELWNGGNPCWINGEILQFQNCVENADGSWTLSTLLRGRRGTEYASSTHTLGETFVYLSESFISFQGDTIDSRGQQRFFKARGNGGSFENTAILGLTYEPRDLMPYAPTDIRRSISGTTITVTWSRRTRTGGEMQDLTGDVPLREAYEKYEVYFLDAAYDGDKSRGNIPDTYLAMFETTSPTVSWTPDSGVFDPILDTVHVLVYQISATVGRGFPGERAIEPWDDF